MEILSCEVGFVNWKSINSINSIILPTGEVLNFGFAMDDLNDSHEGELKNIALSILIKTFLRFKLQRSSLPRVQKQCWIRRGSYIQQEYPLWQLRTF